MADSGSSGISGYRTPPIEEDETTKLLRGLPAQENQPYEATCPDKISNYLVNIICLAGLIIGSIGVAGLLPGSTMGYCAIGLGIGFLASKLISDQTRGECGKIVLAVVLALIPIILGSLGATGVLSATQVGWGLVGTALVGIGVTVIIRCCCDCCMGCMIGFQQAQLEAQGHHKA